MIRKKQLCVILLAMIFMFASANAGGLFPSMDEMFGTAMPSVGLSIGRVPDELAETDAGVQEIYNNFTEDDYLAFGEYLAGIGAVVKDFTSEEGKMTAKISARGAEMVFSYDLPNRIVTVIYPSGTRAETEQESFEKGDSILIITKDVGQDMPKITRALNREPSSTETMEDGGLRETYLDFSEADYGEFSKYLQKTGCTLEDYHTDMNGVLVINLSSISGKMTFFYDGLNHIGIAEYPASSRVEKALAITPIPEPEATPEPVEETKYYSESDCWWAAYTYFKNLSWKNPESLTIHGHTTSYTSEGFLFTIDYSAQNGFGGMNRNYYWITVDRMTCKVISAFGGN